MNLTWHVFIGGTTAARGKYTYQTKGAFGEYDIDPVSTQWGRHMGYRLHFVNSKGRLTGGLWQQVGGLHRSPNMAKGAAKKHYQQHLGRGR